jgi:tripartite-type tricarboxylate transporter receptor subunit TctC
MPCITRRQALGVALAAAAAPGTALSETWPTKPVRLVVPFAAGTTTDIFGRMLANHLSTALGQPVVVDNRSGAGGNIGIASVAKSPADGYTMALGTSGTHGVNASLYRDPGFDALKDFAPVVPFVTTPVVFAVRPELGVTDVQGLLALAKKRSLTLASAGNGTTGHLSQALLDLRGDVRTVHVPYRSGAQAITDLLSGQVDAMFYHALPLLGHVQEGKLRLLGVTSPARVPSLPNLPTMQEQGLKDFVVEGWWAVYLPAGTPEPIIARVNAATNELLRKPEALKTLRDQGVEPLGGTPAALADRTRREVAKWGPVVHAAGMEPS